MIEIKIRELGNKKNWEDIEIFSEVQEANLDLAIETFKNFYIFQELRWNYKGSYQGHYVSGNVNYDTPEDAAEYIDAWGHGVSDFDENGMATVDWIGSKSETLSRTEIILAAESIWRQNGETTPGFTGVI